MTHSHVDFLIISILLSFLSLLNFKCLFSLFFGVSKQHGCIKEGNDCLWVIMMKWFAYKLLGFSEKP